MDKIKIILIVIAVGVLVLAGALSFNLLSSPNYEYDQTPNDAITQQPSKSTAQVVIKILPKEVPYE